jgi:hypothetical protein
MERSGAAERLANAAKLNQRTHNLLLIGLLPPGFGDANVAT